MWTQVGERYVSETRVALGYRELMTSVLRAD